MPSLICLKISIIVLSNLISGILSSSFSLGAVTVDLVTFGGDKLPWPFRFIDFVLSRKRLLDKIFVVVF